jgi:CpeS-like protein
MDIQSFFQSCNGKWVSQRTTHDLIEQSNQSGRSDLWGEMLGADHGEVVALCQQLNLDPSRALCGLQIRWSEVADLYQSRFKPRNEGFVLLVPMVNLEDSNAGQLLRNLNGASPKLGTYSLGTDEALTLRFEEGNLLSEERIWFASPNLRLRSSSIKQDEVVSITTFCSEIRMSTPDNATVTPTAAQSNAS